MEGIEIIDTTADNILEYGICGYKNIKRPGFPEKVSWMTKRFSEGLKIKTLYSGEDGTQGMVEYIPGEYCWRPVDAAGYTFIHCIFSGFKRIYKNRGYGSMLLDECVRDAKTDKTYGVAVVTRKGSFMAGNKLFLKHGFEVADTAPPDFELLVKRFRKTAPMPAFRSNWEARLKRYEKGLTIIRSDQCPYSVKNVNEIRRTAAETFHMSPKVITLADCREAQGSPCAFGTFCIILEGKVIAEHPISNGRFKNIMNKINL
ncbi:MAG: YoaP domain-containing protein [Desulfobacterales bacterium]|nr:YoaP domain-containing protein [Desulfobacterales bacterium]